MNIYQNNIDKYTTALLELDKESNTFSTFRLIAFVFTAVIIIVLASGRSLPALFIVLPLCVTGFALLVKRHNEIDDLRRHTAFLKEINEHEILRKENQLSGFATGASFINRDHPYVSDMDVFGQHSLFQLINRTTTESGSALLAEWLSIPASRGVVLERQEAVRELSSKLNWRQLFQAAGMGFKHTESDYIKLLTWIEKPVALLPRQTRYLALSILLSILSTSAAVYFFSHVLFITSSEEIVSYLFPLATTLLINSMVLRRIRPIAEKITENIHHHIKILGGYESLIAKIELEKFHSQTLQELQTSLSHNRHSAASEFRRLKEILELFQLRGRKWELNNTFYSIFNVFWFLDVYLVLLTEKWKLKNASCLRSWAASVSELEVLSSLAGFHYSNPLYSFPEITEEPYCIRFEMLGHPLIKEDPRVCNDFTLNGRGEMAMITGSNMAGKSTFLRTVGVNLVLGLMGAPCCARSGQMSTIQVFSSMRTQDNLEEGVSSFYAELKRVGQLLKLIESGHPVFFLLDEMFKGTNSNDRHKGGFSLITQLQELNAFGIISTHDLELANQAGKHKLVTNYSFNSDISDGEMLFSYKLTSGLCKDFNASELMKRSGIKILSNIEIL